MKFEEKGFYTVYLNMLKALAALISVFRIYRLARQLLLLSPLLRAVRSPILLPSDLSHFNHGEFVVCQGHISSKFPSKAFNVFQSMRSYISFFEKRLFESSRKLNFMASEMQLQESGSPTKVALTNLIDAKFYQSKVFQNYQQTSVMTDLMRLILLLLRPSEFNFRSFLRTQKLALPLMSKVVVLGKLVKTNSSMTLQGVIVSKSVRYMRQKLRILSRSIKLKLVFYLLILAVFAVWLIKRIFERKVLFQQQILDEDIDERLNCIICLQRKRSFLPKSCRHLVMCTSCFQNLPQKICPVCKIQIQAGIKVNIENN